MKRILSLISFVLILILQGCASVPMAPLDEDARAKDFLPVKNKGSLYIYRNESFGAAIAMTVSVNGKTLGQTAAQTYFRLNLAPGRYKVESHAENVSDLLLPIESGKNYFVWQEVKMGMWMARSLLKQTDEATGRAGVMESKLISTTIQESDLLPLDAGGSALPRSQSTEVSGGDVSQRLKELQNLRKDDLITEDEFQARKAKLLDKL